MTIFDWLERLAFLRGDPAALLVVITAVIIVVATDARLALLALAGLYFAAALLFVDLLDPRLAVVKLLVGWFICLILYITGRQVNWGRLPVDVTAAEAAQWQPKRHIQIGRYPVPLWLARVVLALLTLLMVWWLSRRPSFYLPVLPDTLAHINLAVYALLGFGLLQMTFSDRPLAAGMGAFMFLTGFELFYSNLDQSVAALMILAAVNLAVALAVSYLAQARYALPALLE